MGAETFPSRSLALAECMLMAVEWMVAGSLERELRPFPLAADPSSQHP